MRYDRTALNSSFREDGVRPSKQEFRQQRYETIRVRTTVDYDEEKSKAGIAFLILVVGLLIGIFVAAAMKLTNLAIYGIFVWFLLFAIIAGVSKNDEFTPDLRRNYKIGALGITLLIIAIIVIKALYDLSLIKMSEGLGFLLGGAGCIYVSFLLIVLGLLSSAQQKRRCTEEAKARVIGYDDRLMSGGRRHQSYMTTTPVLNFMYGGREFTVTDGIYTSNDMNLPVIGSLVPILFDPEDPDNCIVEKRRSANSAVILGIFILVFGVILTICSLNMDFSSGNTSKLTDEKIMEDLAIPEHSSVSFIVYERFIMAREDGILYFDEIGGINSSIKAGFADYRVGDIIYWAESDDGNVSIYNSKFYTYKGDHTMDKSPKYENGKFKLTDTYINRILGTDDWEISVVYFNGINENELKFVDGNGNNYSLSNYPENSTFYWVIPLNEPYYWVKSSDGVLIFGLENNIYEDNRLG